MGAPEILILPGLDDSGPGHWQTRWQWTRRNVRRFAPASWSDPDPDDWVAAVDRAVAAASGRLVLVAHSLGCIALARWAAAHDDERVAAAMLVAPCDPERPGALRQVAAFAPTPRVPLPFRSVVVASSDDPHASLARSRAMAHDWGSSIVEAGTLGHINARSGLDDWPFGQVILDDLLAGANADLGRYRRAARLRAERGPTVSG